MKRFLTAFISTAILAVTLVPATTSFSHARSSETVRLSGEGFRKCKAKGDSGFTAVVRGDSLYGATRNGDFGRFSVRTCFKTRHQCERFVDRFPNNVQGVYSIRYAQCSARG